MDTSKPVAGVKGTNKKLALEHLASMMMTAICGGGGIYSYMQNKSLPSLVAGATLGSLYGLSAYWIRSGRPLDGVDLSIVASALLLIAMGPRAYSTGASIPTVLSGLGALVTTRMGYTSYQLRHGRGNFVA